ncbi:MAG: flagellar biosynthesis protein FliQ [Gammaproteobacteria bacterium]|nr:flagellar biosynthesis protein FliQ [Pseudomonadales bacterium]
MTPDTVVGLWREAMFLIVIMVSVIVLPSLLVGLAVSTFQAATQINEQTLSFLPRLLTTLLSVILAGPWLLNRVLDFTSQLITSIPFLLG